MEDAVVEAFNDVEVADAGAIEVARVRPASTT